MLDPHTIVPIRIMTGMVPMIYLVPAEVEPTDLNALGFKQVGHGTCEQQELADFLELQSLFSDRQATLYQSLVTFTMENRNGPSEV